MSGENNEKKNITTLQISAHMPAGHKNIQNTILFKQVLKEKLYPAPAPGNSSAQKEAEKKIQRNNRRSNGNAKTKKTAKTKKNTTFHNTAKVHGQTSFKII